MPSSRQPNISSFPTVTVDEKVFIELIQQDQTPLVIHHYGGLLFLNFHRYLFNFRGYTFFCKSSKPIVFQTHVQVIEGAISSAY